MDSFPVWGTWEPQVGGWPRPRLTIRGLAEPDSSLSPGFMEWRWGEAQDKAPQGEEQRDSNGRGTEYHTHLWGQSRGRQRDRDGEAGRPGGTPRHPPHLQHACTHRDRDTWGILGHIHHWQTHTLSGRRRVALARQLLSSFGVTFLTEKPKHQPPEVASGPLAKHLPTQHPGGDWKQEWMEPQSRGRERPLPESCAPNRETSSGAPFLLSSLGRGSQGRRAKKVPGLGGREGAQHSVPPWEQPGLREQARRPAASPQVAAHPRSQSTGGAWLLSPIWASCARLL